MKTALELVLRGSFFCNDRGSLYLKKNKKNRKKYFSQKNKKW